MHTRSSLEISQSPFRQHLAEDELTIIHADMVQNDDSSKHSQTDDNKSNDRKGNGNAYHEWPLRVRCHDEWSGMSKRDRTTEGLG